MEIGSKIKKLREEKGYSIREFARMCELSPSLVSQVERDQSSPSIASLVKMAEILQCPVGVFFEEGEVSHIVRKQERRKLALPGHSPSYELATPAELDGEVRMLMITLKAKEYTSEDKVSHLDKEVCFVQEGVVEVEIGETTHLLTEGDTISFDSRQSHRFFNPDQEDAKILLFVYR